MSSLPDRDARIRVLIADDQALIRRGMSLLLGLEPDIEVVGQAANGAEAIALTAELLPDIVLMDLHMPGVGGVQATREITSAHPQMRVMVLTTFDADEMVFEAIRAGAQAYLLKDASEADVLETIRALYRGEPRLAPHIARKVIEQFRRLAEHSPASSVAKDAPAQGGLPAQTPAPLRGAEAPARASPDTGSDALTSKEERILELIAEGKSNKDIARIVFLAEGTVKNYVSRIMEKLHARTRTELAVRALRNQRIDR
jgi:DNA-binding NarL/FixJ family response regulator